VADDKQRFRFSVQRPGAQPQPLYSPQVKVRAPAGPAMADVPVQKILGSVQGKKQGTFGMEAGFSGRPGIASAHQFSLDELTFGVAASQGAKSPGHCMYEPLVMRKATGGCTPQFYAALAANESLTAIFDCYGNKDGQDLLAASIKLSGAAVASVEFDMQGDRIALVFATVEVVLGSGTFSGSWS
jgi:type VI protein secretion system component Hcp